MPAYAIKEDVQTIVDKAVDRVVDELTEIIRDFGQQLLNKLTPT